MKHGYKLIARTIKRRGYTERTKYNWLKHGITNKIALTGWELVKTRELLGITQGQIIIQLMIRGLRVCRTTIYRLERGLGGYDTQKRYMVYKLYADLVLEFTPGERGRIKRRRRHASDRLQLKQNLKVIRKFIHNQTNNKTNN